MCSPPFLEEHFATPYLFCEDGVKWPLTFEAKRRFGLVVLNYVVTSNHIHLIVKDDSENKIIPQAVGLIAGRTAQEYNRRKHRKGAYWEDRYHSTAIETGEHLRRCKNRDIDPK
jgi:putative transposase